MSDGGSVQKGSRSSHSLGDFSCLSHRDAACVASGIGRTMPAVDGDVEPWSHASNVDIPTIEFGVLRCFSLQPVHSESILIEHLSPMPS